MIWRVLAAGLVGMLAATAASGSERFVLTSIVCPVGQSGVLELVSTRDDGLLRELLKVSFTDGVAVLVEIEAAEGGNAAFSPIFKEVPFSAAASDEGEIARNAAAFADRFLVEFCQEKDPAVRKQRWLQLQEAPRN